MYIEALIVLYAMLLTIIGIASLKKIPKINSRCIFVSSVLVLLSVFDLNSRIGVYYLIIGFLLNQIISIKNGFYLNGKVNVSHHILRGIIHLLIVGLYVVFLKKGIFII